MAPGASDYLTVEYHSRELPSFPSDDEGATAGSGVLFDVFSGAEGVLYAKKDYNLAKHPQIDVPNLQDSRYHWLFFRHNMYQLRQERDMKHETFAILSLGRSYSQ
ncbi:hypothetical protein ZEAMMB73_Zm00001d030057 [Zea mays]|uniref:Uncharacterized protein n=1 Tax=Zea mays TaxID=4577 RepID=A0A1D6K9B5_MAIZE|nr:hypothetical protein ZEAMMB73_Zm00001d030057 [Zea mays]